MVHRSSGGSTSDMRALKKGGGKTRPRRAGALLKNLASLALLVALLFALPKILGPGFWQDQAREVAGFVAGAGAWVRAALLAAFQSIPTR